MKKPSKYRNVRTELDGEMFDSAGEARWYAGLKLLQKAGKIRLLERQSKFELHVNGQLIGHYIADATWVDDAKGKRSTELPGDAEVVHRDDLVVLDG